MGSFDDLVTAQELESVMRRIAQEEIKKERPAARYAVVTSIDTEDRSAMVRFVGETDPVRVVYTLPAPSVVGQEVRIAGTGSDRYIDAIRGTSDEQQRIVELEAQRTDLQAQLDAYKTLMEPTCVMLKPTATFSLGDTTIKVPFSSQQYAIQGTAFTPDATGTITFNQYCIMKFDVTLEYDVASGSGLNDVYLWPRYRQVNGTEFDLGRVKKGGLEPGFLYITDSVPVAPGDKLWINGFSNKARDIFTGGTRFYIEMVKRL